MVLLSSGCAWSCYSRFLNHVLCTMDFWVISLTSKIFNINKNLETQTSRNLKNAFSIKGNFLSKEFFYPRKLELSMQPHSGTYSACELDGLVSISLKDIKLDNFFAWFPFCTNNAINATCSLCVNFNSCAAFWHFCQDVADILRMTII